MSEAGRLEVEDGVGILTIDSPPVNALGLAVRKALDHGFQTFADDPAVRAIVLICEGRTFFAGADISELGKPLVEPGLLDVFDIIENGAKPVVAAIHGTALGGGLELALICHYRIAVPSAKVGLPEVKLGLLPGAGGTQRLPRVVGVDAALDLIASGRALSARQAQEIGVLDALCAEGELRPAAIAFARKLLADGSAPVRVRDREDKLETARKDPGVFDRFRKANARAFRGFKAPENIVKAIEAAAGLPFDEGLARERELFEELRDSKESAAQRYYFFAERQTPKVPDLSASTPTRPVESAGVIGAGTMGGGIAMSFLDAGVPVTLVETTQAALDRGLGVIRRNYEASARKGRLTEAEVERRVALIRPALSLSALREADLVVEAVFESLDVKRQVFGELDTVAKPGSILASNTSFLDLNRIAAATKRPQDVVGLHFFSPANVMRLLEVVRGDLTASDVLATALQVAKTLGKVPVVSGVCDGFIANRLMRPRMQHAERLVLEGPTPAEIDQALYDYGFAIGPFQMIDLVGLDVIGRGGTERTLRGDLVARGRLGQKQNGGFYDYDEARRAAPSPVADEVIAEFARHKGVEPKGAQSAQEIVARLLFPVVNEGAKILQEKIALRASDIDVAAILGYNWPVYTGGPMFWADTIGLSEVVQGLRELEAQHRDPSFSPADNLVALAAAGGRFTG